MNASSLRALLIRVCVRAGLHDAAGGCHYSPFTLRKVKSREVKDLSQAVQLESGDLKLGLLSFRNHRPAASGKARTSKIGSTPVGTYSPRRGQHMFSIKI